MLRWESPPEDLVSRATVIAACLEDVWIIQNLNRAGAISPTTPDGSGCS